MDLPFKVRAMLPADFGSADHIRFLIGWNQTLDDWERLFELAPDEGCFVAELNSEVAGTVTTIAYPNEVGWIGMLLVHPAYQRRGIGMHLLVRAIDRLHQAGVSVIGLDATPAGQNLYRKAGFNEIWKLARWESTGSGSRDQAVDRFEYTIEPSDWPAIIRLDEQAVGMSRLALLSSLARRSDCVLQKDAPGRVRGFAMLRKGANAYQLGPMAADDDLVAVSLLNQLWSAYGDLPWYWDIPQSNSQAIALAQAHGFTLQRPLSRMVLGSQQAMRDVESLYAIADLATG